MLDAARDADVRIGVDVLFEARDARIDIDRERDVELGGGRHVPVFERPRHRDELVRRARFEEVGQRGVVVAGTGDVRRSGRRRAEHRRHREHVAVRDVHGDRHAAVRPGRLDLVEQRVLRLPLQVLVDREHHVGPALGRDARLLRVGDVVAEWVLLDDELAGLAGEQRVVLLLDARQAGPVGPDLTDHRGRDRAGRVAAGRFRNEADARELHGLDGLGDVVVDRVRDVGEVARRGRAALVGKGLQQPGLREVEHGREPRRFADGVGDERGIGVDGRLLDRHREVAAVAVEDAAALRAQGDGVQREVDGQLLVLGAADELELADARRERAEREDQQRAAHSEPERGARRSHGRRGNGPGRAGPGPAGAYGGSGRRSAGRHVRGPSRSWGRAEGGLRLRVGLVRGLAGNRNRGDGRSLTIRHRQHDR